MFSVQQKRAISDAVQKLLRATNHPELPEGEINFHLHVDGAESWSWADIKNNGDVPAPDVNPWNEMQDFYGRDGIMNHSCCTCEVDTQVTCIVHPQRCREDKLLIRDLRAEIDRLQSLLKHSLASVARRKDGGGRYG